MRLVDELERLVDEIGQRAGRRWPDDYESACREFFGCGAEAFGWSGPDLAERLEAELWLVCDRDLGGGGTALDMELRDLHEDSSALAALAASRIRPWRIEALRAAGLIAATCPLSGEEATLETVRPPAGEAAAGRLLVARSVPRGEDRFALLGRSPVIDPEAQREFETLLTELSGANANVDPAGTGCSFDAPRPDLDRLLAAHGGRILAAAWSWPEVRERTFEGEVVAAGSTSFELSDLEAAIESLKGAPSLSRIDPEQRDEPDVAAWHLLAAEAGEPVTVAAEPGVRWEMCEEDTASPRRIALVEVDPYDGRLWIFAPTLTRLERAERELQRLLGNLVGERYHRDRDLPDVERRWQRERWERRLGRIASPAARSRSLPRAA